MKKIFTFVLVMAFAMCGFAKEQTVNDVTNAITNASNAVSNSVATVHDDVVDVVSTVHEDASNVVSTLYSDAKAGLNAVYPEVKEAIAKIANALGVAAEHVYTVLVKQFLVKGLVEAIPFVIGLVLLIVGWIKTEKYFKTKTGAVDWHICYPIALITIGFVFVGRVDYTTMMTGIFNPEFGAINYILDFTKNLINQ